MYHNNTVTNLKATIPVLNTAPKAEKLFDQKQKDVNKITEGLANEYFKTIVDSSVLPFWFTLMTTGCRSYFKFSISGIK